MFSLIFRCFCIFQTLLLTRAFFNQNSLKSFPKPRSLRDDSFYGFSIAYQPIGSRLFVSAPQASHTGQIYYINVNTGKMAKESYETHFKKTIYKEWCIGRGMAVVRGAMFLDFAIYEVTVLENGLTRDCGDARPPLGIAIGSNLTVFPTNYNPVTGEKSEYNFWLGASVATGPDFYVTCIPRNIEPQRKARYSNVKVPATLSICYLKQNEILYELEVMDKDDRLKNISYEHRIRDAMDSFGWSIHVSSNQRDILIGGAAMYKGRVSLYNVLEKDSKPTLINQVSHDNPVKYSFGYSVTSGKFFSDQIVYAISTTYGDKGYGKVYFFNRNLENIGAIIDDQVASMFGAALCSATIRGPALLVGSPTYADNEYSHDVGAVYIYAAQSIGSNHMAKKIMIKGFKSGGYFGQSIVSLGDLDDDGNDEIAIAAPYEDDGRGAVYIYSGVGIFEPTIRKRIQPGGLHAFGFSLASMPKETESNGLAVGAIGTHSSVVILNSIASITVELFGSAEIVKNDTKRRELNITSCVDVEYPKKPVKINADLKITIKVSDKLCTINEGEHTYSYVEKIRERESPLCRNNVKANCLIDEDSNLIISYEITATLKEDPENTDEYDPSKVLISERSILVYRATEYTPCEGKICKPVLQMQINSTFAKPYIVGSSEFEYVTVYVTNSGDPAYGACVELHVQGAVVSRYPSECTTRAGADTITCKHSIRKDQPWVLRNFKLEPRQGITSTEKYYVEVKGVLYNDCNKQDHIDFEVTEKYHLKGDTDSMNITGQANPVGDVDVTPDDLLTERKSFEHLYRIENKGITDWVGMQVQIILPDAPYIGYPEMPIKIYSVTSYRACPMDSKTRVGNVTMVTCNIGDLPKSETTVLTISMEIVPNNLELDQNKPNVTVTTTLQLLGTNKSLSEQSLVKLQVVSVPTWVIATASVIGLLLFALVVFALYEFGFLKRKNKDKLVALKEKVYRQSVIRNSMRAAARRNSTTDIQFLTDDADDMGERQMTIDEKLQHHK